jgi:peptidoglycan hydrolase-like protein with peptidoglycan-binding domain
MENFKFILFSIIILTGMGLVGYWAVRTIEPGNTYMAKQKQIELEEKNQELQKEIEKLKSELLVLQPPVQEKTIDETITETPIKTVPSKYKSLIADLEKMVAENILMKEKSQGTRVGTLQTFLNIYNNTSKRVDNDFGAGTKTDVINFQKAEKLLADGEAGASTFQKMIDWLKKQ